MKGFEHIPKSLRTQAARAQEALSDGFSSVRSSLQGLPVLSSMLNPKPASAALFEETHYFLVPYRLEPCGYVLFWIRRVPDEASKADVLPKLKVFHLPSADSERTLASMILKDLAERQTPDQPEAESTLDDRLNRIAAEIDKQSKRATGGLLLIGGLAALANPLVGAAIAANALVPSLSGIATREGLKHVAGSLRGWRERRAERKRTALAEAEYQAGGDVRALVNPMLATLERALNTHQRQFDPLLDFGFDAFAVEGWQSRELLLVSAHVVDEVYRDVIKNPRLLPEANLGPEDLAWLSVVSAYAEEFRRHC